MFTGIVSDVGEVLDVEEKAEGLRRLKIACGYDPDTIEIGASIACSGICLTVVERGRAGNRHFFAVDAAAETLRMTTAGDLAARHPAQSRTLASARRRARRPHGQRPCRRHRRADRARRLRRQRGTDAARAGGAGALHRAQGLGRARRRVAHRQRGRRRHVLGADHPAHLAGDDARRAARPARGSISKSTRWRAMRRGSWTPCRTAVRTRPKRVLRRAGLRGPQ